MMAACRGKPGRQRGYNVRERQIHPFTSRMPANAASACLEVGIPRLRLCREAWEAVPKDNWTSVPTIDAAASKLELLGSKRVFLTTGRQHLAPFANLKDVWFLVRSIDPPNVLPLANCELLLARGPFTVEGELDLMQSHQIDTLVTKNSGGSATSSKLAAARSLGIKVVMVDRPEIPAGPHVTTVEEAVAWCKEVLFT